MLCRKRPVVLLSLVVLAFGFLLAKGSEPKPPYPPSPVIKNITWHWETLRTAAPGSDLWPVTWAADGNLYVAWGDGGGFGGTDRDGRVALGFGRIEGPPIHFVGINLNGGKDPLHPASFLKQGKAGGILAVETRLYAWVNLQNGKWPDVDEALIWSDDNAATWKQSPWVFPKGAGNLKPSTFLNFGKGCANGPPGVQQYAYFYGQKQSQEKDTYIGRVPLEKLTTREAYEFCSGIEQEKPIWSRDQQRAVAVFSDSRPTGDLATVVYNQPLKRYLLTIFHRGPGQLGIFDSAHPWGPWTTVAYYNDWGQMGSDGEGLTCSFPLKWISTDGLTLWAIFAAYGAGAKEGINAHDKFNLVQATLKLR